MSGKKKQAKGLHKAVSLDLWQHHGARAEGPSWRGDNSKLSMGPEGGHTRQQEVALYEALSIRTFISQATQVFDMRALGLPQVKAVGLVQVSDLNAC